MNELFLVVLSLSLSGSLVALLLFLLKPAVKHRLSKTWQYYVFIVVIVRLLLPFGFETNLVGMIFDQAGNYVTTDRNPEEPENVTATPRPQTGERLSKENAVQQTSQLNNIIQSILKWSWLAWMIPAIILLLRKIIRYCYFVRSIKSKSQQITNQSILTAYRKVCENMHIQKAPVLVRNDRTFTPMLVGICQPVIVLPDRIINRGDLCYVFQHELTHHKRFDLIYKWFVQIAVCIHWFNPLILWLSREIDRNCELSCDESVLRRLNKNQQRAYGNMLLDVIKLCKPCKSTVMSITLGEDAKLLKERLGAILKFQKKSKGVIILSVLLGTIILCGAAFSGGYYFGKSSPALSGNKDSHTGVKQSSESQSAGQYISFDKVEMRRYDGEDGHPYIHETVVNNTEKVITGYQQGMLAFDKHGNPLKIDWWSLDTDYDPSYYHLYSEDSIRLVPGQKYDELGGYSLNYMGIDPEVEKIDHVLYCMKEITFEDGSTWVNPDYNKWLDTYRGKTVAADDLESYYPYTLPIQIN